MSAVVWSFFIIGRRAKKHYLLQTTYNSIRAFVLLGLYRGGCCLGQRAALSLFDAGQPKKPWKRIEQKTILYPIPI
ncbi:hypothetical protein XENTR_v10012901 [Xenopus tropicalis]|nr:hypothetical protein XENTR_v10012901 [Xenopus tropicalis]